MVFWFRGLHGGGQAAPVHWPPQCECLQLASPTPQMALPWPLGPMTWQQGLWGRGICCILWGAPCYPEGPYQWWWYKGKGKGMLAESEGWLVVCEEDSAGCCQLWRCRRPQRRDAAGLQKLKSQGGRFSLWASGRNTVPANPDFSPGGPTWDLQPAEL